MADLFKLHEGWEDWVAERPPQVQELCRRFPMNKLYRLKETGHFVTIAAYNEAGTLRVDVRRKFNPHIIMERSVFGILPDDMEECELPETTVPHAKS